MKHKESFISLLLAASLLVAGSLACGRQQEETPTPIIIVATATVTPAEAGEAPIEAPAEPTSTPIPGGCVNSMVFRADVTVPDGTVFDPGETFIKTWRIQNNGTCDWSGYHFVFDHGEPMGTLDQLIPDTPAGEELDLSVEMTAPGGPGSYRGYWRIESPDGARLGTLFCDIAVAGSDDDGDGGGEEPIEQPLPSGLPDLIAEASVFANIPTIPEAVMVNITVRNVGDAGTGAFSVTWTPHDGWSDAGLDQVACSHDVAGLPADSSVALNCSYTYPAYGEMHWLVVVDNEGEIEEANETNNEARGRIPIFNDAAEPETITVQSLPAEDGIVRGVTSGVSVSLDGNIRAGDGTQNQRNEGFLSFDISGIPQGARIESAVLDLSGHSIEGTPFVQLGLLRVYFIEYDSLGTEDYVAGNPTGSVTQSARPTQLLPTSAVQRSVDAGAARFQVRMQFEGISDNDGEIDGLIFPEGGPALTITYTP